MKPTLPAVIALLLAVSSTAAGEPKPVWEVGTAAPKRKPFEVRWVGFSPDGKRLVARFLSGTERGRDEERVAAWEVATRKQAFDVRLGDWDAGVLLGSGSGAMTGAGTVLFPGGRTIREWGAPPTREVRLADGQVQDALMSPGAVALWVDPGARRAVCAVSLVAFADALTAGPLPPLGDAKPPVGKAWASAALKPAKDEVRAVAASPDLKRLAVATSEGRAHDLSLYSVAAGEALELTEVATVPAGHGGHVSVMQFSPDGKALATGSGDSSVCLWDAGGAGKGWKPRGPLPLGQGTVSCLAFSPDGKTLAAGTFDKKGRPNLYLIDVGAGKVVGRHRSGDEQLTAVAYSPDGKLLVTGDNFGAIRAWDPAALRD